MFNSKGEKMRSGLASLSVAFLLAACATEAPQPPPEPEPVMLSDEAFKALWNAAYNSEPESEAEVAFTQMLEREDLTAEQRGEVYYGRGTLRGIYVRDWPEAYPQCALGDFMKAKDYPLSEARLKQMKESMFYQLSRQQYFTDAPRLCQEYAAEAGVWLYAGAGSEG